MRRSAAALAPERLVLILAVGLMLSIFGDANIYISLPTHTEAAGISIVYVGLMQSLNRITRIIVNGPYGLMIERLPRRPLMLGSLLFGVLSNFCYLVPGFWPLLLGRVFWGLCWAGIWLGAHAMLFDIVAEGQYGRRTGQLQMGFWVGAGVSSLFSGVLTDWLGYREYFVVSSAVVIFGWLLWWFWLPETFGRRPPARVADEVAADAGESAAPTVAVIGWRWRYAMSMVVNFLNWFAFLGVAGSFWPIMIDERTTAALRTLPLLGELGVSSFTGILTALVILLVNALAAPWVGRLSDQFGRPWLMLAAAILLGGATMLFSAGAYGVGILLGVFLQGVVMSVLSVLVTALVGEGAPRGRTGRWLGLLNVFGDAGGALGPLLAFALLPLIGLGGVLTLTGILLLLALPPLVLLSSREALAARAAQA